MIIYNARIHTLDKSDTIYENGFIEFNEKITRIGDMRDCPAINSDTRNSLDAKHSCVMPGFIDSHTHVGVWGNGEGVEGDDGNETTDPCTPHLRAVDTVNPSDYCFIEAAQAGVTTVICGPGSSNPIAGTLLAMKTVGSPRIDSRIVKDTVAVKMAFGENPKMIYRDRNESPVTRMATAAIIREQLYKAKRYLNDISTQASDPDNTTLPEYDMKCEALLPILRCADKNVLSHSQKTRDSSGLSSSLALSESKPKMSVHAHCHRADDIFTAVRIAEEFNLKLVIVHATDSALIADELKTANVPVIIGPVICDRGKPELVSHSINVAGILEKHGVKFAIATDHPEVPVQYLPLSAGLAIRGGLNAEKALKAITIDAAEICGIDERVGSLEVGKDADMVIFNGNFYDVLEVPKAVFIDGKEIPLRGGIPESRGG